MTPIRPVITLRLSTNDLGTGFSESLFPGRVRGRPLL